MNAKYLGWLLCLAPICAHAQSAQDVETVIPVESFDATPVDSATHRALGTTQARLDPKATANTTLAAATGPTCLTDTTQSDFQAGTASNVDVNVSPGDVVLVSDKLDQQNTTLGTSGVGITTTTWGGQTFTPAISGQLTRIDVNLFCSGCTGTTPNLTLSLRAASGGLPTGADLASATITGFSSGSANYYTATFGTPATLTAGTQYAFAIRPTVNPSPGTYALTRSGTATAGSDVYSGGTRVAGATSGTVWSIPLTGGVSTDSGFRIYINNGYDASGTLDSSIKDANPPSATTVTWTTLSWNAATPTNTTVQFQIAGSTSVAGPFNFVGPDNTSATYFTSGSSLSQFDGMRYLKYRAVLSTGNTAVTPTLNDATVCYANLIASDLAVTVTDGVTTATPGRSVTYTITASNAGPGNATGATVADTFPASLTCTWTCVGAGGGTCTASGSGNINDTVNLPAGGSVTYTPSCVISAAATGTLSNTATVAAPGGVTDPIPRNNSATDSDTLAAQADLAITNDDGVTTATPGGGVTYTITASNAGPSNATGATVADTFPASLTCTWTCVGAGGGTCTASGSGNINDTINLPAGGSVTYTPSCVISAAATGTLSNTATVAAPGGVTDPTPGNNSATDYDTLATYTISGDVSGATSSAALTLSDSTHGTSQSLSSSGAFAFPTPLPGGSNWNVAVTTPPSGQSCVVTNGTGTNLSANVTNVQVTCATVLVNIAPATLANAMFSVVYSQQLSAASNDSVDHSPYTFTLASGGSLPPGLTLGTNGLLSGTPTAVGSYPFTVQAAGSGGVSGTQAYTLVVDKKTTTITLAATPNPTVVGNTVNLIATVAGDPPSGTVNFSDNGATLACSPVTLMPGTTSSTAVCASTFATGSHSISATYSGDGNFATATSAVSVVTVNAPVQAAVPAPALDRWAMLLLAGLMSLFTLQRLRSI